MILAAAWFTHPVLRCLVLLVAGKCQQDSLPATHGTRARLVRSTAAESCRGGHSPKAETEQESKERQKTSPPNHS
jgi:hypothetical protein